MNPDRTAPPAFGLVLIALVAAVGPLLAFSSGAYLPRYYLPVLLLVAAAAAVAFVLGPPATPNSAQLAALVLFALLAGWTALSLLWAGNPANAWEETNRVLLYGLGFALATLGLSWARPRGPLWLACSVLAGVSIVAAACALQLLISAQPLLLFGSGRLSYPITYWNGLAALLMIGFWLALGLTLGRWRRWWLQPLFLALAVGLAEVALLPQSRGALWAFAMLLPAFVALAPHRFRAVTNLALLLLVVAVAWPRLVAVYPAGLAAARRTPTGAAALLAIDSSFRTATREALLAILVSMVAIAALWTLTYLVERAVGPLKTRWRRGIGIALLAAALLAGVTALAMVNSSSAGGLGGLASRQWHTFTADRGPTARAQNRFTDAGLNGRLEQWRVAVRAFGQHPLQGLGAQNFEAFFQQHRTTGLQVRQAHSRPLELLAELGLPGLLLWVGILGLALIWGIRARFTAERAQNRAVMAAMVLAALSWTVHSSVDWLWQLGGVTWPAVLLLAGLLAGGSPAPTLEATERRRSLVLRWGVTAVALLALASGLSPYLSLRYTAHAYKVMGADRAAALAATTTAAHLNPLTSAPLVARAQIYATDGTPEGERLAAVAWEEALAREPANWYVAYLAGLASLRAGDAPKARSQLELAARLNPHNRDVSKAVRRITGP